MEFDGLDEMMSYDGKVFISDCEGPITRNHNAFDLCVFAVPQGERFFQVISRYDSILSDMVRKEGYKAGDMLKLILPFFKAFGLSDSSMLEFCRKKVDLWPGADKTMRFVQEIMTPFIVSSSYEHYISAVCERVSFPFENSYCTRCNLDGIKMGEWERQTLKDLTREIVELPVIDAPFGSRNIKDLKPEDRRAIQRLDQIFWHEITDLDSYHLIMETVPIGDAEKASAVVEVCKKVGVALEDCFYIGDDHTDARALSIVRKGGGLAVSFNGNSYAVREADIAIMSPNTIITSMLAEAFYKAGKDAILDLLDNFTYENLRNSGIVHEYLIREARRVFPEQLPEVRRVTPERMPDLATRSTMYRRSAEKV